MFNKLGVPPNSFKDLKGAANQKRLKNTGVWSAMAPNVRGRRAKSVE
jgi:hypothetical protein